MPQKKLANVLIKCLPTHGVRQAARRKFLSTRKVACNDMVFDVEPSEFWYNFDNGKWEPETYDFYKKYISPVKDVIDIGGWIGPTMLFAYSMNARKISVVEADPANFQILKKNCRQNHMEDRVELHNLCLSDRTGQIVMFGTKSKKKGSSTKRIGYGDTKVTTTAMMEFLQSKNLKETSIIKIDIEGAEQDVTDSLDYIAQFPDIAVLFSVHVPMFRDAQKTNALLAEKFKKFDVFTDTEEPLSLAEAEKRLEKGGSFCLILKTKKS
jgi:FkbM family methyltransferase